MVATYLTSIVPVVGLYWFILTLQIISYYVYRCYKSARKMWRGVLFCFFVLVMVGGRPLEHGWERECPIFSFSIIYLFLCKFHKERKKDEIV